MIDVAVLISGSGTNLQALIDNCARDDFPARIVLVISNNPGAKGLKRAEKASTDCEKSQTKCRIMPLPDG